MMLRLPSYDLHTNDKSDVWLYKHGNYNGLNSGIDKFSIIK